MPDETAIAELATAVARLAVSIESPSTWPRWLSVELAAKYSSLGQKSLRNMIAAGELSVSRAIRGRVLVDRLQLDALLLAGCGRRLRKGRGIRRESGEAD